jgi:hypothetical protein
MCFRMGPSHRCGFGSSHMKAMTHVQYDHNFVSLKIVLEQPYNLHRSAPKLQNEDKWVGGTYEKSGLTNCSMQDKSGKDREI